MAAPSRDGHKPSINRQTTAPFHLKLFYRVNNYNPLSDYSIPVQPRRGGPVSGPNSIRPTSPVASAAPLPPHLEIYTWQSCTLRELSQLLTSALPSLLPDPPVGTRLCFRLIYPDARGAAMGGPDARGRYLSRDLGSAIVGPRDSTLRAEDDENKEARPRPGPLRFQGSEADRPLQDARFIVGDYIECAILAPLEDGSVAPALNGASGPITGPRGGGGGVVVDLVEEEVAVVVLPICLEVIGIVVSGCRKVHAEAVVDGHHTEKGEEKSSSKASLSKGQ
ncbi:unnamed protein product [Penicillium crustosum]